MDIEIIFHCKIKDELKLLITQKIHESVPEFVKKHDNIKTCKGVIVEVVLSDHGTYYTSMKLKEEENDKNERTKRRKSNSNRRT